MIDQPSSSTETLVKHLIAIGNGLSVVGLRAEPRPYEITFFNARKGV